MKKYTIPSSIIYVETALNILAIIIFARLLFFLQFAKENFIFIILLIVTMTLLEIVPFAKSMIKKSVVLDDDSISLCHFHINGKYQDVRFSFADINTLSLKRTLNLKMTALRLDINNCGQPLLIDATFNEHKELYAEIFKKVKVANHEVYVEDKLIEYLNSDKQ